MPETVIRTGSEICDGDEIALRTPIRTDCDDDIAIVLEKTIGEDDRVVLVISVSPDAALVTRPRPREEVTPFEHGGDLLGDGPITGTGSPFHDAVNEERL
jgi:hypothetical protein